MYAISLSLLQYHYSKCVLLLLFFLSQVASKGWFIAIVSTTVETDNPEKEIELGVQLLGPVKQKFIHISDVYEPLEVLFAWQTL